MSSDSRNTWFQRIAFAGFFCGVGAVVPLLVLYAWLGTYPDDVDPKNIYYVLWKHGLNSSMNLDNALAAMSHDAWPEKSIEGLTKDQLRARFGYLRTLEDVGPYYQACYLTPGRFSEQDATLVEAAAKSEAAFFLRDSPWMVVMREGRAVDLVMCKGY